MLHTILREVTPFRTQRNDWFDHTAAIATRNLGHVLDETRSLALRAERLGRSRLQACLGLAEPRIKVFESNNNHERVKDHTALGSELSCLVCPNHFNSTQKACAS